jgi:hypothetical protein
VPNSAPVLTYFKPISAKLCLRYRRYSLTNSSTLVFTNCKIITYVCIVNNGNFTLLWKHRRDVNNKYCIHRILAWTGFNKPPTFPSPSPSLLTLTSVSHISRHWTILSVDSVLFIQWSSPKLLFYVDPLLGNDREISTYTTVSK